MIYNDNISNDTEYAFNQVLPSTSSYTDDPFPLNIEKIENNINHKGRTLRKIAMQPFDNNAAPIIEVGQSHPTVLQSVISLLAHLFSNHHVNSHSESVLQGNNSTMLASATQSAQATANYSPPLSTTNTGSTKMSSDILSRHVRQTHAKKGRVVFARPRYSPKDLAWIDRHTLGDVCYENFRPFADKISKLCGQDDEYQLAVKMNNKWVAITLPQVTTLDVVLAFDPRSPMKTKEIERQDDHWVFSPKTDPVVSVGLLTYYKALKPRGLLNHDIANRSAYPPDDNGLRPYRDKHFVIIRGDNVIIDKIDNALFLVLKTDINRIHVPIVLKDNRLHLDSVNKQKVIGAEQWLSHRVYQQTHPQQVETFINTVNLAHHIISSIKSTLKTSSPDHIRALIQQHLHIKFNDVQINKITKNILRLDALLKKIINSDNLYRNFSAYNDEKGITQIHFYAFPHRAAGEVDLAARLNNNTLDIYPAFYQQPELQRIFILLDLANRSQRGKSFFLFNTDAMNRRHSSDDAHHDRDIEHAIHEYSQQIINHRAQLSSDDAFPSQLQAGIDARSEWEKRNEKFMRDQYWRYFAEHEQAKQASHLEQTLLAYQDGGERWHMPLSKATELMRADRHFLKKCPRDSSFLTLVALILYQQETR